MVTRNYVTRANRDEAAYFTCEHCGNPAHRSLSSKASRAGYRNKYCSMACRQGKPLDGRTGGLCSNFVAGPCPLCEAPTGNRGLAIRKCAACLLKAVNQRNKKSGLIASRRREPATCCICGLLWCALTGCRRTWSCPDCTPAYNARIVAKHRSARKALQRSVTVELIDPIKVLDRDNWHCYLCGIETPRHLRGTYEPNAPEVDHVHPISKGGAHSYANTRCACRRCNITKRDRLPG